MLFVLLWFASEKLVIEKDYGIYGTLSFRCLVRIENMDFSGMDHLGHS